MGNKDACEHCVKANMLDKPTHHHSPITVGVLSIVVFLVAGFVVYFGLKLALEQVLQENLMVQEDLLEQVSQLQAEVEDLRREVVGVE